MEQRPGWRGRRPRAREQRPGWRGRRQYRAMAEDGAAPGMGEARGAGRCEQNGRPGMPTEAGSATGAAADMTGACGVGKIKRDLSAHCVLCDGGGWSSVRAGGGRRGRRPRAREQRPGWRGRRPRAREQRPGWRGAAWAAAPCEGAASGLAWAAAPCEGAAAGLAGAAAVPCDGGGWSSARDGRSARRGEKGKENILFFIAPKALTTAGKRL